MSYNNTSISAYIRPLQVCIGYSISHEGHYNLKDSETYDNIDVWYKEEVYIREAGSLTVVREFEQADICNPTAGINYVGGFYPAWPINNPYAGLAGDVDYSIGSNGVGLWTLYTWEQDGEDQVASHCVHVKVEGSVSTVTVGDIELGYACGVEVREVLVTPTATLAEALEALEVAELEADEAAMCANTDEGYKAYCAAVRRLFDAEDVMLAAGELAEELYVPTDRVEGVLEAAVVAAQEEADIAATRTDTWEGYQEYCAAVQRLFDAEDALKAANILS